MHKKGKAEMLFPVEVKAPMEKGERITRPFRVETGEEVSPGRISCRDVSNYGRILSCLPAARNE